MIRETIITTLNADGSVHASPLGVHVAGEHLILAPFRPGRTLDNLEREQQAVINYCTDVRVFAGCLTGYYQWPSKPAQHIRGAVLDCALTHQEVQIQQVEADDLRPRFHAEIVYTVTHKPFMGFNRAQAAVIEAAILVSRLHLLPTEKIQQEIDYLHIAIDKTAGPQEREAWGWLMARIAEHTGESILTD